MKAFNLFALLLLFSCQKPKPAVADAPLPIVEEKAEKAEVKNKFLKTDTMYIADGESSVSENYILANLLSQKADKDSIVTSKYQLDFYQNKTKTASSNVAIKGYDKGSEWSASYGTSLGDSNSFIEIDFGYPACGYTHDHYLYYLSGSDLQLVHEWFTMSDSGWGSWVEFTNPGGKSKPDFLYCKTVAFGPEDDNEDMGIETHYDSIAFHFKNNRWTKQLLSEKDKAYFEQKKSFNDFHQMK